MSKEHLRKEMLNLLAATSVEHKKSWSRTACQRLNSTLEFQKADVLMVFLSFGHEIDTTEIVLKAWQQGKTVVAPKVLWSQKSMIPVEIHSLESGLVRDCCGLRNPESGNAVAIGEIDMVVVPGLGFDRKGNRLGRGGAYYDRFFSNENLHAVRCGLAYHKQLVDKVPVTERDQTVDMVVTDAEVLYFNGTKGDSNGQVCQ